MNETGFNDSGFVDGSSIIDCDISNDLHPARYELEHIDKLQVFSEDVQKAIQTSFPRAAHPYTSVTVLLLRWTDDDLNVQIELDGLRVAFEGQFSFTTEQWNIPSQNPTRELQTKLYDFQHAHQMESELLIVYYGGHGEASRIGKSIWAANKRPDSPTLAWSSLQHLLENAVPHVLIILDCCFAANAARDTAEGTTKELLAACGRENPTTGVGFRSFTSALIEELQAFGPNPFTVAMLHSRLVTIRWRLKFTPIYALLSEHGGNSIQLSPLPAPKVPKPLTIVEADGNVTPVDDSMDLSSSEDSTFSPSLHQSSQSSGTSRLESRVLLAISIQQDATHDISQWVNWLTTKPPWDVTKIEVKVEGTYESHSTLLLVSLPIFAWDNLPHKDAYRFIAFIRSSNLQQPRASARLASRALDAQSKSGVESPSITTSGSQRKPRRSSRLVTRTSEVAMQDSEYVVSRHQSREAKKKRRKISSESTTGATDMDPSPLSRELLGKEIGQHDPSKTASKKIGVPSDAEDAIDRAISVGSKLAQPSKTREDTPSSSRRPSELTAPVKAQTSASWRSKFEVQSSEVPHSKVPKVPTTRRTSRAQPYPPISAVETMTSPVPHPVNRSAGPWSAQDDEQLQQARQRGMSWRPIAQQYFPTKTANACRKRHERLMEKGPRHHVSNTSRINDNSDGDSGLYSDSYGRHNKFSNAHHIFDDLDSGLGPEPDYSSWNKTHYDALYASRPQPCQFPGALIQQQSQHNSFPSISDVPATTAVGGMSSASTATSSGNRNTVEAK